MRLDNYLFVENFFDSRTKAKQAIERGEIFVNGKVVEKPSYEISLDNAVDVEYRRSEEYVSLGGYKISKALSDFNFKVEDFVVADIGASTGGFTDCLLQKGTRKVFAVDLNDGLLHEKLKNDDRVKLIVKNAKDLTQADFDEKLDLIVADLSFISITSVIEVFNNLLGDNKYLLVLVKPQFETGQKCRYKNGIIRDKKVQLAVCNQVYDAGVNFDFAPKAFTTAPINQDKNIEFLMLFEKNGVKTLEKNQITF